MVQQVKSYAAADGKRFDTFEEAATHEIGLQITKERPDLKSNLSVILANARYLAAVLKPLAPPQKRPPEKVTDHPRKPTLKARDEASETLRDVGILLQDRHVKMKVVG